MTYKQIEKTAEELLAQIGEHIAEGTCDMSETVMLTEALGNVTMALYNASLVFDDAPGMAPPVDDPPGLPQEMTPEERVAAAIGVIGERIRASGPAERRDDTRKEVST